MNIVVLYAKCYEYRRLNSHQEKFKRYHASNEINVYGEICKKGQEKHKEINRRI